MSVTFQGTSKMKKARKSPHKLTFEQMYRLTNAITAFTSNGLPVFCKSIEEMTDYFSGFVGADVSLRHIKVACKVAKVRFDNVFNSPEIETVKRTAPMAVVHNRLGRVEEELAKLTKAYEASQEVITKLRGLLD